MCGPEGRACGAEGAVTADTDKSEEGGERRARPRLREEVQRGLMFDVTTRSPLTGARSHNGKVGTTPHSIALPSPCDVAKEVSGHIMLLCYSGERRSVANLG